MVLIESTEVELKKSTRQLSSAMEDICAFANNGKGTLYFGVTDDGKVTGQDISENTIKRVTSTIRSSIEPCISPDISKMTIDGKTVLVVEVKNCSDRPYFYKGKSYKRVGKSNSYFSRSEIERAFKEKGSSRKRYEKLVFEGNEVALDRNLIDWFLRKVRVERNQRIGNGKKPQEVLTKLNLLTENELNLAGLVCFGKKIQKHVPQAVVECGIFDGKTKAGGPRLGSEIYNTNIFDQIESVQHFFMHNFRKRYEVNPATGQREYEYEWPLKAIREAVTNAVVHRDYTIPNPISIGYFDDRVEIRSPGGLPEGMTMKQLTRTHNSVFRNPEIANVLYLTKFIERWGIGIEKINRLLKDAGLPEPLYEEIGSSFVVTFMKATAKDSVCSKEGLYDMGMKTLYSAIKESPGIQAKDLSLILENRPIKTIERQIKKLKEYKLIERRGSRKLGGYWPIKG